MQSKQSQKLFTIGRRCGRLANRLIIFANFIALAEEQGHRVINYTFHSYSDLFPATRDNLHCAYPPPLRRSRWESLPGLGRFIRKSRIFYHLTRYFSVFNERLPLFGKRVFTLRQTPGQHITYLESPEVVAKLQPARTVFVYDWRFRAPQLVQKHGAKIRTYFRPQPEMEAASRAAVEPLRQLGDVVIGVHVRHGDYKHWRGGRYFYPAERYAAWMRELAAQFPDRRVVFLVCSDGRRAPEEFPGLTVGFGTKSPVSDLYALAQCDFILGPPSTFSQWASFYGAKPLRHLLNPEATVKLEEFRVSYLDWDNA